MELNALLTLKQSWRTFCTNHPQFPGFLKALKNKGAVEGAEMEISVKYPDGQTLRAGIKLKATDVSLINTVTGMLK